MRSFPTPLSPRIKTVESSGATRAATDMMRSMAEAVTVEARSLRNRGSRERDAHRGTTHAPRETVDERLANLGVESAASATHEGTSHRATERRHDDVSGIHDHVAIARASACARLAMTPIQTTVSPSACSQKPPR